MVQLVLSYSRHSKDIVDDLARALRQRGLDVWYDRDLPVGRNYRKEILERIITSGAVLVIWSNAACNSNWVIAEAETADKYDKLLQIKLEKCELPLPFDTMQSGDLSSWKGDPFCAEIDAIVNAATSRIMRYNTSQQQPADDDRTTEELSEIRKILNEQARI